MISYDVKQPLQYSRGLQPFPEVKACEKIIPANDSSCSRNHCAYSCTGELKVTGDLKPSAQSRLLSLLETISEALLHEAFLWGCVRVIFQANSLLFYWRSKSRGPRFLSRNTAHSRFLSLVSCDQKQISNMLDL